MYIAEFLFRKMGYSFLCHDQIQPFVKSARMANDTLLSRHSLLTNDAESGICCNSFVFSKLHLVRLLFEKMLFMRTRHLVTVIMGQVAMNGGPLSI